MALDEYLEDSVRQIDASEDKSNSQKWNSATQAIGDSDRDASGGFECNICLDYVQEPVVTLCGHLYCWPCIYKWLHFYTVCHENEEPERPRCPVCKSEVSQSALVPLYGRGQTTAPSKFKSHHAGTIIPQRPPGPVWAHDSPRSYHTTTASQPASQFHPTHYPPHPQQYNAFDTTLGVFGGMIYARVFGNQLTNMYTYPNSYNLAGNSNPRIRRQLMQANKSLSRICFFLLCCTVLCLLLF